MLRELARVWILAGCVAGLPLAAKARVQAVPAAASAGDEKPSDQNWFPWLGERVKRSPASERTDYKPDQAGYVKLEVAPHKIAKASFCGGDGKQRKALAKAANEAWNKFIKKQTGWGVGIQIWYASSDDKVPDVDRAPLTVTQFGDEKNCASDTDSSEFGSPLLPHPPGMAPVRAKIVSWRTKDLSADQIKKVTAGIGWAANLAGVPAAATNFALGEGVQKEVLSQLKGEIRTGDKLSFAPNSIDSESGGGRVVNVYLGMQKLDMDTWKPAASTEPRLELRMLTVASVFDPDQPTYRDLPDPSPYFLLQKTKWNGKPFNDYLASVSPGAADGLRLAVSVDAFDGACGVFRNQLNGRGALSDVDVEVALYALGLSNPSLGAGASGAPFNGKMPIAKSNCLRQYPALLKKVGIVVPDVMERPQLVAATVPEMRDAMVSFSTIGDSSVPEMSQGLVDRIADKVELIDPQQMIVKTGFRQTLNGRPANAEFMRVSFGKAGCWISLDPTHDPLLPNGFSTTAGPLTHAAALGRLEDDRAVFVVFEFAGHETGKGVEISRIGIDDRFQPPIRALFKATYPNVACGAASAKPDLFQ